MGESAQRQLAGQSMPKAGNFQGGEASNMSSFTDMHHNIEVSAREMPSNSHNKITVQGPMFTSSNSHMTEQSSQEFTSKYAETKQKEQNLFGTTLLTTQKQHHTKYAREQQMIKETTVIKKGRQTSGKGWEADAED